MHVPLQPTPWRSAAALLVVIAASALSLPLLLVPVLSRSHFDLWRYFQRGGYEAWLLLALGLILLLTITVVGALRASAPTRPLMLLPLVLPVVAFVFYHRSRDYVLAVIDASSLEPLSKLRILSEAASGAGAMLSIAAFLATPAYLVVAACAAANAVAVAPRLSFGRRARVGAAIGFVGLVAAVSVAATQPGDAWLWSQGVIAAIGGVALTLCVLAAIDGDEERAPIASSHGVVSLLAFAASLGAAYFAARSELTNQHLGAIGAESYHPPIRAEAIRGGVESLVWLNVTYVVLFAPFVLVFVNLLRDSKGRAIGASVWRNRAAIGLGPLAIGALVLLSPAPSWTLIEDIATRTEPSGFAFISSSDTRLERYGGIALYVAKDSFTVAGGADLRSSPLQPIDDCSGRLKASLSGLPVAPLGLTALAIARDASTPGIRCAVQALVSADGWDLSDAPYEPILFFLVLEYPNESAQLPTPFDTLAPFRGTTPVRIAAKPSRAGATLHLAPEAWLFVSDTFVEHRLTGSDEERFAQLRTRVRHETDLRVTADPTVRAEWIVRALLLSSSPWLALEPELPEPSP